MSEHEFLSASEQLTSFLDGELDSTETSSLFYELAQNPELQEEMKDLILIRNSFRNSRKIPPANLKQNILATTGLSSGVRTAAGLGTAAFFLKSFLRRPYIAGLLGIAAIATTIFFLTDTPEVETAKQLNVPVSSSEVVEDNSSTDNSMAGIAEEERSSTNSETSSFATNFKSGKNVSGGKDVFVEKNSNDLQPARQNVIPLEVYMSPFANRENMVNVPGGAPSMKGVPQIFGEDVADFLQHLSLNFRIADGASYPNPDLNSNSAILNDFAVAIMYNANSNNSFGIEFGRENFLMEFEGFEGELLYRYPQSYNAFVFGLAYQYQFSDFDFVRGVSPYARFFAGGTKIGPVGKVSTGLYYNLTHNVVLNAGAEYGILAYSYTDNIFTTQKIGWTVGLSLGF